MKLVVCFRKVGSPNDIFAIMKKHSPLPLAIFQPEEINHEHCVEDNKGSWAKS